MLLYNLVIYFEVIDDKGTDFCVYISKITWFFVHIIYNYVFVNIYDMMCFIIICYVFDADRIIYVNVWCFVVWFCGELSLSTTTADQ